MRRLIYSALTASAEFMALLPGGLTGDRSLVETPEAKPFGVLMYEGPTSGSVRIHRVTLRLWVHDEEGDYTRIDAALKTARSALAAAETMSLNGVHLLEARWQGDSADLYDDARGTNVKNSTYTLVGSGV